MAYARNGDVRLYFDTVGDPADPALLLISGLGRQCINYRDEFCQGLAARGYFVVRFDNRDVGLSTKSHELSPPDAPYLVSDMARDAVAVLDELGIHRAHVWGASMGGMIAQAMAIEHGERLLSLTSMMSTTGDPDVGQPTPAARELLHAPRPSDRESYVALRVAQENVWGSPDCRDVDRQVAWAVEAFERNFYPRGVGRQYRAIRRSGSRTAQLARVSVPTLVVHGDCDTLIDVSGGRRTADAIPGARFVVVEGLGHDYPPEYWDRLMALVHAHLSAVT